MALADFYLRDAVAISQVLQGFQTDAFIEKLKGVRVAIAFGEEAAASRDGRNLLDLSVRLAARLYPSLTFVTIPAGDWLADELMTLASVINPNIDISKAGTSSVALAIGADAPAVDAPTIYAGCDGWLARVGTRGPYSTSDTGNPFGAGFAACLAAANLFRFLFLTHGTTLLDVDASFPPDAGSFPSINGCHSYRSPGPGRRWCGRQQRRLGPCPDIAHRPGISRRPRSSGTQQSPALRSL